MDKAVIKAKKVECIIGLFFLLPPVLGVFAFVFQLFGADTNFSELSELSAKGQLVLTNGWRYVSRSCLFGIIGYSWSYLVKMILSMLFLLKE